MYRNLIPFSISVVRRLSASYSICIPPLRSKFPAASYSMTPGCVLSRFVFESIQSGVVGVSIPMFVPADTHMLP